MRARVLGVGLLAAVLLSACGGGDGSGDGDASATASSNPPGAAAGSADRCPLTAGQVGGVLGTTVDKDEAACTYYPAGDDNTPNASFNRQLALACRQPSEAGYTEKLDGLAVDAYIQPGTAVGTMVLACPTHPFEITVDMGSDRAGARAAAQELARLTLQAGS